MNTKSLEWTPKGLNTKGRGKGISIIKKSLESKIRVQVVSS